MSEPTAILTIAVPTFDRPEALSRCVESVVAQLTPVVRLVVLDNCSRVPASEVVGPLLAGVPGARVVRNPVNVGGSANVLRCVEFCETEWVWVVGDDDRLLPGAVARVLDDLERHPGTAYFNYASPFHSRDAERVLAGIDEFVGGVDSLGGLLFISACVLNAARLRPHMAAAYQFLYSFSPHLVLALCAACDGGVVRLMPSQLVEADLSGYSRLTIALGFGVLPDLPQLSGAQRRKLGRLLRGTFCSFDRLVSQLVFETSRHRDTEYSLYYFDQLAARLLYFERNPLVRLKARASRLLVRFPSLGRWLLVTALSVRYSKAEARRVALERGTVGRLYRL